MVEFEKVTGEDIRYGENSFLEVTLKKAVSGEGENEFIALVGGVIDEEGNKRYKKNFSIPMDEEVVNFIAKKLPEILEKDK